MAFEWAACKLALGDYGRIVDEIYCDIGTNLYCVSCKILWSILPNLWSMSPCMTLLSGFMPYLILALWLLEIHWCRSFLPPSLLLFSLRLTNMALRMQMEPQCGRVPPSAHVASLAWHAFDHKQRAFLQLYKLANQVVKVMLMNCLWHVVTVY